MDKKRLRLLALAYEAEIDAALRGHGMHMMQTKSALAEKMVEEGLLSRCVVTSGLATFRGYELTHAGRADYCLNC